MPPKELPYVKNLPYVVEIPRQSINSAWAFLYDTYGHPPFNGWMLLEPRNENNLAEFCFANQDICAHFALKFA